MRKVVRSTAEQARPAPDPEFSRPFAVDKLGLQPAAVEIAAKPAERAALAARFDLSSLDSLTADLGLRRAGSGLVRVEGRLLAQGAQVCVVSLEPVPFALDLPVSLTFASTPQLDGGGEILVEVEGDDPPEPIEQGAIDLGEAMAQTLSVALDPFPRLAEAVLTRSEFGPGAAVGGTDGRTVGGTIGGQAEQGQERQTAVSPFAALEGLRGRRGDERDDGGTV